MCYISELTRMQRLCISVLAGLSAPAVASDFTIAPILDSSSLYRWEVYIGSASGQINPALYLARGITYSFNVTGSALHPFYIKTTGTTGSTGAYSNGLSTTLPVETTQTFTFDVPQTAPDSLFYTCSNHSTMIGKIDVVIFRDGFDGN